MNKYIILTLILIQLSSINAQMLPGDGLVGSYYQGYSKVEGIIIFDNLTETFSRVDTLIDFWNGSSGYRWQPVAGYGDNYSVRWEGFIYLEQTGPYGFGTISDDGSQIFIDDSLIVDNSESQWYDWEDNMGEADTSGTPFEPFILQKGFHKITIAFFENASYDGIELWWITPSEIDSSDIPWYGNNFHSTPPVFNPNTNWELIPKRVLYTKHNFTPLAFTDSLMVKEDSMLTFNPLLNDHDPDSNLVLLTGHDMPLYGRVETTDSTLTYFPDENYFGPDSFHYFIMDSLNAADTGLVVIEVIGVNDAPQAFSLIYPADGTTLDSLTNEMTFIWTVSQDVDDDPLHYTLNIFNAEQDTQIIVSKDSSHVFNGINFFRQETNYQWTTWVSDGLISVYADTFLFTTPSLSGIQMENDRPQQYVLRQNYPNPFNPVTQIQFTIPMEESVHLEIYNTLGELIENLVDKSLQAGAYTVEFNAGHLPSGVYFYRLQTDAYVQTRKMILLK